MVTAYGNVDKLMHWAGHSKENVFLQWMSNIHLFTIVYNMDMWMNFLCKTADIV